MILGSASADIYLTASTVLEDKREPHFKSSIANSFSDQFCAVPSRCQRPNSASCFPESAAAKERAQNHPPHFTLTPKSTS
jgi:hypothetical protein